MGFPPAVAAKKKIADEMSEDEASTSTEEESTEEESTEDEEASSSASEDVPAPKKKGDAANPLMQWAASYKGGK